MPRVNRAHARPKTTVLLSGGIDSTACLAYYLDHGARVEALFIDYGQAAAKREASAARLICQHFRVPLKTLKLAGASRKNAGLIVGRNAFLLLSAELESNGRSRIVALGIHSGTKYPDCSPIFVAKMQSIFDIYAGGVLQIAAPFLKWRKPDVWAFAKARNVPLRLTYSCERGLRQPCASCESCLDLEALRASSLHEN